MACDSAPVRAEGDFAQYGGARINLLVTPDLVLDIRNAAKTLITWTSNIQAWISHGGFEFSSRLQSIEIYTPRTDEAGMLIGLTQETVLYDDEAFAAPLRIVQHLDRLGDADEGDPRFRSAAASRWSRRPAILLGAELPVKLPVFLFRRESLLLNAELLLRQLVEHRLTLPRCLTGVWQYKMSDELWSRIRAIQATVSSPLQLE